MQPNEAIETINAAYHRLGYKLGWRLLSCPWRNLGAEVAVFTLNPGAPEYQPPLLSVEEGSAFLVESWHGYPEGEAPLQKQIQRLCSLADADIHQVLAASFIPFRSPSWASLQQKHEATRFSRELWSRLLQLRMPRLIFTLGGPTFESVCKVAGAEGFSEHPSGWGAVKLRRSEVPGKCVIVGLPHLSRFQLFGRADRDAALADLLR